MLNDPPAGLGVCWIDQPEAAAAAAPAPVAATVVPPIAKNSAISEMTVAAEDRSKNRRRMRDSPCSQWLLLPPGFLTCAVMSVGHRTLAPSAGQHIANGRGTAPGTMPVTGKAAVGRPEPNRSRNQPHAGASRLRNHATSVSCRMRNRPVREHAARGIGL